MPLEIGTFARAVPLPAASYWVGPTLCLACSQCKLDPTRAEAWTAMGCCLVKTEDFVGAQTSFERSLERVSDDSR